MRFPFSLLLILIFMTTVAAAADTRGLRVVAKDSSTGEHEEVRLYGKSYAVIIGIDRYRNLPPDRQLSYAVRDAKGVEEVLRRLYRFDKVVTLYDEQATRDRIMRLLTAELPREMTRDDALFLFWAGHGNQEKTDDGDLGYLIPHDGSMEGIYGNVTMSQLRDDISRALPAKHIFFAFDACYSGLLTTRAVDPRVRRDVGYLREITKERVRQVLTAGSKGQEVLDGGPKGHSVFTGRLIEILEQTGDYTTANELQAVIREKVYGDARGRGFEQTPGFGILSGSGDFVFIPSLERKVADNSAELDRMQRELAELEAAEAAAQREQDEQMRRDAGRQRKVVEIRLKAEEMKRQQLVEEERKRAELETRKREDEQRLASVRAELERKRLAAPRNRATSFEIAMSEMKSLVSKLGVVETGMKNDLATARQAARERYDARLHSMSDKKDEFETDKEFQDRMRAERVSIVRERDAALAAIDGRIALETAPLREQIKGLAEKEYRVGEELLQVEVDQYDPHRQAFTVAIKGKGAAAQLSSAGEIKLQREAAKEFKQHHVSGLVRADVRVRLEESGSLRLASVAVVDEVNGRNYPLRLPHAAGAVEKDPSTGMEFAFVKGGCFQMGDTMGDGNDSEKPVHEVCLDDFFVGRYEVTQEEWERVMGTNPAAHVKGPRYPVENVSWNDAQEFIDRLNKLSGRECRLPTEAEWEYAARSGGKEERFPGFSDAGQLYRFANICDVSCEYDWKIKGLNDGYAKSSPVGSFKPNGLGLYDMSGNVWEWVGDWYRKEYYSGSPRNNPVGPASGSGRVSRGGSWSSGTWNARAAYRYVEGPDDRRFNQGVRLVCPAR